MPKISATSQFFINVRDNTFLDQPNAADGQGYAVFGKVTEGADVVDKIRAVSTDSSDMPLVDVTITKVEVIQ